MKPPVQLHSCGENLVTRGYHVAVMHVDFHKTLGLVLPDILIKQQDWFKN